MYDIPFDRSFLQLSNGIRHVTPSADRKLELTAKASMAQPVSQPAVRSNGLKQNFMKIQHSLKSAIFDICENHTRNNTPKYFTRLYSITIHAVALFQAGSDSADSKKFKHNRRVQANSRCLAVSLDKIWSHRAHQHNII